MAGINYYENDGILKRISQTTVRMVLRMFGPPAPDDIIEARELKGEKIQHITMHANPLNYRIPEGDSSLRKKFESEKAKANEPPQYIIEIHGGRVFGCDGMVIDSQNRMVRDTYYRTFPEEPYEYLKQLRRLPIPKRLRGRIVAPGTTYPGNYYHWMIKILPRVMSCKNIKPDYYYVEDKKAFQRETIAALGIGSDRLIRPDPWGHYRANTVLFPSMPSVAEYPTPRTVKLLREAYSAWGSEEKPHRRLYIKRSPGTVRRIENECNLEEALKDRGFESVELSGKRVSEQVRLFSESECLVGGHGAGLTNLAFCGAGVQVLEIMSPYYFNCCYWALANAAGLHYSVLAGKGWKPGGPDYPEGNRDYEVEVSEICTRLDEMLE